MFPQLNYKYKISSHVHFLDFFVWLFVFIWQYKEGDKYINNIEGKNSLGSHSQVAFKMEMRTLSNEISHQHFGR